MVVRHSPRAAETEEHLKERVLRLVRDPVASNEVSGQMDLYGNVGNWANEYHVKTARTSISEFLGVVCDSVPNGGLYMFGGVLRDLAMFGRKGFASDVDLVVEGDWSHMVRLLISLGGRRNRFGGFRLQVGGFPVDIWEAKETWAIREGLVRYRSIESLTRTTILNWDAILLDWRTKTVICRADYFPHIQERLMDIVLVANPNPLGTAVRAFRHLCLKDAKKLTSRTVRYLSDAAKKHGPRVIIATEFAKYGERAIDIGTLEFFNDLKMGSDDVIRRQFDRFQKPLQQLLI